MPYTDRKLKRFGVDATRARGWAKLMKEYTRSIMGFGLMLPLGVLMVTAVQYSRRTGGKQCKTTTIEFIIWYLRSVIALVVVLKRQMQSKEPMDRWLTNIWEDVFGDIKVLLRAGLAGFCYAAQGNFMFISLSHLEEAQHMVLYRAVKVISTGLVTITMIIDVDTGKRRWLNKTQWFSMILLLLGIILCESSVVSEKDEPKDFQNRNVFKGSLACVAAALLSGFAGVWWEKQLKAQSKRANPPDFWVRNLQMNLCAAVCAFFMMWGDREEIIADGFFANYTTIVWIIVLINCVVGYIQAWVLKITSSIAKSFAGAATLILGTTAGMNFFDFQVRAEFLYALVIVIIAQALFAYASHKQRVKVLNLSLANDEKPRLPPVTDGASN